MDIITIIKKLSCACILLILPLAMGVNAEENQQLPVDQVSETLSSAININTANAELLADVMSGVGVSKAAAIIAYREQDGDFSSIDDLVLVKGVGTATVDRNRTKITVN